MKKNSIKFHIAKSTKFNSPTTDIICSGGRIRSETEAEKVNLSRGYIKQLSCLTSLLPLLFLLAAKSVNAQLIPDNSLGKESSIVNPSVERDLIEGGAIRDNNLFHSFQEFNVNPNQKVYFSNPENINNILTRVTGNNLSRIFGTLGINGNANLFLINPKGIVFGENSKLDIGGSFLASTGNSIVFDNYNFNTINPKAPPLLKINLPLGIQLGRNPGEIEVQGKGHNLTTLPPFSLQLERNDRNTGLKVNPGNTFALIGGNVSFLGGVITAETGKIELAAVNQGFVGIRHQNQGWKFDYSRINNFGDIELEEKSLADVSGVGSGFVEVKAQNLLMSDGSVLWTQNLGDAVSGNINVNVSESLLVDGTTADAVIRTGIFAEALEGNGGNVRVDAKKVTVLGGANIAAYTSNSDITASSEFGIDGNFNLNLQELDITSGLIQLPDNLTDASDRISAGCPTDEEASFITSGRGGIPQNPRQFLQNEIILQDLRNNNSSPSSPSSPSQIKEATRWIVNKDGDIEFIAENNRITKDNIFHKQSCQK